MRLTDEHLDWLCQRVPDAPVSAKGGRPVMCRRDALRGSILIMDYGAKCKDLPRRFGSKSAVHRWFSTWVRAGVFEAIMRYAGRLVGSRTTADCASAVHSPARCSKASFTSPVR